MKRLYQGNVFEMNKLKQKLDETQTSPNKLCSLLAVLCGIWHHFLNKWPSSDYISVCSLSCLMKVPAATYDAAIQANYLSATEGVFGFAHMHKCL